MTSVDARKDEWLRWRAGGAPLARWTDGGETLGLIYADMPFATAIEQTVAADGTTKMRCVRCGGWAGSAGKPFTMWVELDFASCAACGVASVFNRFILFSDGVVGETHTGIAMNVPQ